MEHQGAKGLESTCVQNHVQRGAHRSSFPYQKFVLRGLQLPRGCALLRLHHLTSWQLQFHVQLRFFDVAIRWSLEALTSIQNRVQAPCRCGREEDLGDHDLHESSQPLHGKLAYPTCSITLETDVKLEHRHTNRQQAADNVAKNSTTIQQWKTCLSLPFTDIIHEN